jgi:deoxycytidine triphosphate deaminase
MILSDREIIAALKRQFIRITPEPDPSNSDIWSSTALDLRLDAKLQVWKASSGLRICQLIFEEVHGTPSKGYDGSFSIQGPDVTAAS